MIVTSGVLLEPLYDFLVKELVNTSQEFLTVSEIDVTYRPVEATPQEARLGFTPGQERPETHFGETLAGIGNVLGGAYGGVKDHALEEAKLDIAANNGQRTEEQKQRPFWSPVTDQDLTNLEVAHGAAAIKAQNHIDMANHIDKSPEQYKQHLAEQGKVTAAASQNPEWFAKRFNEDSEALTQAQENLHYHYNAEKQVGIMTNLLGLPLVELQQSLLNAPAGAPPEYKEALKNKALDSMTNVINDPKHSAPAHLALHNMVTQGLATGDPTMYNTLRQLVATGRVPKENLDSIPDLAMAQEKYRQSSGNQLSALHEAIKVAQQQHRTADVTNLMEQYAQLAATVGSTDIKLQPYAQAILESEFASLSSNEDKIHEQDMMQTQEHAHTANAQQEHYLTKARDAEINGDLKGADNYTRMAEQVKETYNERSQTSNKAFQVSPSVTKAEPIINKYNVDDDKGPALDPLLIKALIQQESSGDADAVSSAGATGIMQLMPATAARFGVTDRKDPDQNIRGGIEYLKFLTKKFNGNIPLILAGYNAGEGAVEKHGNTIPPYKETQDYVRIIMGNYRSLQKAQNSAEASDTVNTNFDTYKESMQNDVAMQKFSADNADTLDALRSNTLSSAQILELSPKLRAALDSGNFPEKAKLKMKTEIVKLLASATHKAVAADVTTLTNQMQNGDAQGAEETMQTILAVAKGGSFQYTQSPAVVKALNAGIETVTKSGRVEDAVKLQQQLQELAPDSNFDDNIRVISQGQADARKPAWISLREKSFKDNQEAITHALGGPRKINSQREAYEALLPKDQQHLLDDVNTADYYAVVAKVPGVDMNRLHQIYTLISGKASSTKVKALLTEGSPLYPGEKIPLASYTNSKALKALEDQEASLYDFGAEQITSRAVKRIQAQGGSPQLGTTLEQIIELNNRGEVPIARDPEGIPKLFELLSPQLTLSDSGIPEITRVQALGGKNAQDYQKLLDQTLLIAAGGGSAVQFIQDQAAVNTHWEKGNYKYASDNGEQNDPTGWAMSNNYVKNLSDQDRGEFMRMWEIGKTINSKPMEQLNLTIRAFEQRSPNFKGIKVRGSLPEAGQSGSVQRLSEYLKTEGNASEDIQKLLTSVPVQNLIKQKRGVTTTDNLGLNWTWNVTENLTLQGFRPGKTHDEAPLEITKDEWAAGTLRENNSFPGLFAPDVTDAQSPGDWVHKTLQARFTQQDKVIDYGTRVLSRATKNLDPAEASLHALKTVLGAAPTALSWGADTLGTFTRDVVKGVPVKVVPRKTLSTVATKQELSDEFQKQ